MQTPRADARIRTPPSPVAEADEGGGGESVARRRRPSRPLSPWPLSPEPLRRVLSSPAMASAGLDAEGLDPHMDQHGEPLPSRRALRRGESEDLKAELQRPPSPGHAGSPDPEQPASPRMSPRLDSPGCRCRAVASPHASPLRRSGLVVGTDGPLPGSGEIDILVDDDEPDAPDELRALRIAQTHRSQLARGKTSGPSPLAMDLSSGWEPGRQRRAAHRSP